MTQRMTSGNASWSSAPILFWKCFPLTTAHVIHSCQRVTKAMLLLPPMINWKLGCVPRNLKVVVIVAWEITTFQFSPVWDSVSASCWPGASPAPITKGEVYVEISRKLSLTCRKMYIVGTLCYPLPSSLSTPASVLLCFSFQTKRNFKTERNTKSAHILSFRPRKHDDNKQTLVSINNISINNHVQLLEWPTN